jgi:penicillin-binding protein 2
MLTGLAALESGAVTAKETIRSTGVARIAGFSVPEYGYAAYGNVDMRRALEVSSNIYFGTLGNRLGREKIYDYIAKFGLTGVANGEINDSVVKNAGFDDISLGEQIHSLDYYKELLNRGEVFYSSYAVQMAYGQLNEFTVMQMANYVSMLANGGTHYKPYMVEKITSANGEVVELFEPTVLARQDFSPENLQVIREGMQAAAKGSRFRNLPFKIAGKTGTSQERGKDNHAWWVGYAPYDNPEIAIAINLEYGGLGLRCEEVARDIIDHYFGLKE